MRYAGLIVDDFTDGKGISTSFWVQGCPHKCLGCHNPQTWDFNGGYELPYDIYDLIDRAITANGIQRNFSLLGGEPFCDENIELSYQILEHVRRKFPDITIYAWTGSYLEQLREKKNPLYKATLGLINVLIDGPYEADKRDVTLPLRGSRNQRILYKGRDF